MIRQHGSILESFLDIIVDPEGGHIVRRSKRMIINPERFLRMSGNGD